AFRSRRTCPPAASENAPGGQEKLADDSKASNVGERYAQALFDLASEQKQVAAVEADLKSLKTALAESRDLRVLLASPKFSSEEKGAALVAIAGKAKFNATTGK